jgi:Asp-tRNA(Asn)/Glu-tRNA(Gln) amidotransferase A subunit family amidase
VELVHRPATELAALIAAGEVSAAEVRDAHLRRIDECGAINAFVAMAPWREPLPGPLSGVPFTVKDNTVLGEAAAALEEVGARVSEAAPPPGGHDLTVEVWRSYADEAIGYDLLRRWDAFRSAMLRFGERFDVMLSPVFPTPAPPHGEVPNLTSYTTPHSLTGWPAATVRCGTSAGGLPIGVQVIAQPWRDDVALSVAAALDAALGGYAVPA